MAQAGNSALFLVTSTNDTEASAKTATDIVEFNGDAGAPDAKSHTASLNARYDYDLSITPNPARNLSQIQDSRFGTLVITIKGYFDLTGTALGIAEINNWIINDQTNASFPFGRIGLRWGNGGGEWNLTPSAVAGYLMKSFEVEDIEDFESRANFTVVLYRNGSI